MRRRSRYRQDVLRDVLANPLLARQLYDLTIEAHARVRRSAMLGRTASRPARYWPKPSIVLQRYVALLKQLRGVGTYNAHRFSSEGFKTFFAMLDRELKDDYFISIQDHLNRLKFRDGVLDRARNWERAIREQITRFASPKTARKAWMARLMTPKPPAYTWSSPAARRSRRERPRRIERQGAQPRRQCPRPIRRPYSQLFRACFAPNWRSMSAV